MLTLKNTQTQVKHRFVMLYRRTNSPVRLVPVKLCGFSDSNDHPYTQTN